MTRRRPLRYKGAPVPAWLSLNTGVLLVIILLAIVERVIGLLR
jgi:hypothetical protein